MTFAQIAGDMLDSFQKGIAPTSGMAHFAELQKLSLDGSDSSLERLDEFLLGLHSEGFADEIDLDEEEFQNFLYLVSIYLGKVAGDRLKITPNWVTWDVVMEPTRRSRTKSPKSSGPRCCACWGNLCTCR